MSWFKRKKSGIEALRQEDPPLGLLLDRLSQLTEAEARQVDAAVQRSGLGVSTESSDNIAIMLTTSMSTNRDPARAQAQLAGQAAAERSPGGARCPRVVYAAGVVAEAFAIRGLLDRRTWEYLTRPWREHIDLPAYGEERVGSADQVALACRAFVEERSRELERAQAQPAPPTPAWVETLLDRANAPRFTPAMMDAGMSRSDAERLLAVVRREVRKRIDAGVALPEITTRHLGDLAAGCLDQPVEAWDAMVGTALDTRVSDADELDRLMNGPYEAACESLVAYLYPRPVVSPLGIQLAFVQEEVLPGLHAILGLHGSGRRLRRVTTEMLSAWGVTADVAWAQASDNMVRGPVSVEPWPDAASPMRIVSSDCFEAEWLGLVAHRLPDPGPTGHLVALPFRGSALVVRLDHVASLPAIRAVASAVVEAYRHASTFDDQLYRNLLWLKPDGTPVVLFDLERPPTELADLPPEFVIALTSSTRGGGAFRSDSIHNH